MSLAVLERPLCRTCQYNLLRSFAATAGVSLPPALRHSSQTRAPGPSPRWYTQRQTKSWEESSNALQTPASSYQDESMSEGSADTAPSPSTPIPWYLQVDTPEPPAPSHPLAERQLIPELPPSPPTILAPILHYLSIDSGLDNLSLIDLRHLDPPPALGANLLMIIGSARSVKHLNVSADRFCRWLRSNYKMRPYADGLLGRNELKLKLRRKARRLKLAQSVGNTLEASKDDGITTGWICVNLGSVEGVEDNAPTDQTTTADPISPAEEAIQEESDLADDGYMGFGSRSTAPRVVVQMFTEEKRAEMDLEGLWDVRRARRAAKDEKADDAVQALSSDASNEEPFAVQRPRIDFNGGSIASGRGYKQPSSWYATAAS